jgi:hypothetical protein
MSLDCLSHASSADGLTTDYYDKIDDKYMDACYVASYILQTNVFSFLGSKVHVKSSLSGIREKLVFRQKPVNDMLRVTVYYDGRSGLLNEDVNLSLKISEVKRKLTSNRMTLIKEDNSRNGKPKLVFSLTLSMNVKYPIRLEVQFSNKPVIGIHFNDHIDYKLMRLKRGDMPIREMMTRFPSYRNYQCNDDEDYHDTNIIMRI